MDGLIPRQLEENWFICSFMKAGSCCIGGGPDEL
jgi:hypothetical protein